MSLLLAAPFIAVACGGEAAESAPDRPSAAPGVESVATAEPAEASAATTTTAPDTADAAWLDIPLTDVASGETFTLASLKGQVVALEPMAIWCSNCKAQQDNVKEAYADVQAAGVHYISLGVDPNEAPDSLAKYAQRRDYPWTFSQSSNAFARALSERFGPQILSPPSTPLIVLDASGEVVVQTFGSHGPDELVDLLAEAA